MEGANTANRYRYKKENNMKLIYDGGTICPEGTYWDISTGNRVDMIQGESLESGKWVKASTPLMLSTAPVLGLIFAVFLPAIGIVMAIKVLGNKIFNAICPLLVQASNFGWRPAEAYFIGRKKINKK
jgi:hypothetical protein